MIATPGGIDTHIHMIAPQQAWEALSNGITTMLGGGTGPVDGTRATTCTPGEWHIAQMLRAADVLPVNWGVLAKGNASDVAPLREQVEAGACGLKVHEDWGSTPAASCSCSCRARARTSMPGRPLSRPRPPRRCRRNFRSR